MLGSSWRNSGYQSSIGADRLVSPGQRRSVLSDCELLKASKSGVSGLGRSSSKSGPGRAPRSRRPGGRGRRCSELLDLLTRRTWPAWSELLDAVRLGHSPRTCRATAGGSTGRVLTRGGRSSQNRLSDDTVSLFFGSPARAGRTLTVQWTSTATTPPRTS